MSIAISYRIFSDVVVVMRKTQVDADELGTPEYSWDSVGTYLGSFQPVKVSEREMWHRIGVQVDAKVYLPGDADVTELDRIVYDNLEYDVVGVEKRHGYTLVFCRRVT